MATIRKRGTHWQAQIRRKGQPPISKTFPSKSAASQWVRVVESKMDRGSYRDYTLADKTTLGEVLFRYQREVLPTKKSQSQVTSMINQIVPHLGAYTLGNLTPMRLADYRDGRLLKLSAQSVKHELSLISRVLNHASREWGIYLPHGNPIQLVTKPRLPPGRSRRLQPGEEERLLLSLRHSELLGHIVTFALETALRRGEIASMKWEQVDIFRRMLTLPETKTDTPRTIPLSTKAADVLNRLQVRIDGSVWGIRADSITQGFDRACRRAGIQNLRFHDLRHEATSRLFEKGLNVMEVATITGHSDLRMLRRYTHLSESLIIHKLDNCCHMKTEHSRQVERSVTEDEEEIS